MHTKKFFITLLLLSNFSLFSEQNIENNKALVEKRINPNPPATCRCNPCYCEVCNC